MSHLRSLKINEIFTLLSVFFTIPVVVAVPFLVEVVPFVIVLEAVSLFAFSLICFSVSGPLVGADLLVVVGADLVMVVGADLLMVVGADLLKVVVAGADFGLAAPTVVVVDFTVVVFEVTVLYKKKITLY